MEQQFGQRIEFWHQRYDRTPGASLDGINHGSREGQNYCGQHLDCVDVRAYGSCRVVTKLEHFQHHFSKSRHKHLLMTRKLISTARQPTLHYLTRSVRRASGYVVCRAGPAARRRKSSTQPDGGEGLAMTQGLSPQGGLKEASSKCASR